MPCVLCTSIQQIYNLHKKSKISLHYRTFDAYKEKGPLCNRLGHTSPPLGGKECGSQPRVQEVTSRYTL